MASAPESNGIAAVLFDYGLVLTGPAHPPAWMHMKEILGADEPAFHDAYWQHRPAYDRGDLSGERFWQAVGADLHQTPNADALQALLRADTELWTQPNQPMIDWAAQLQARGIRTGILSNLGDAMEEGVLAQCNWMGGFYHLTFSHRLRTMKPDPAIYRHAAEGLGLPPAEILFIDDREENVHGARLIGMQAVQYTDHAHFVAAMRSLGFAGLLSPAS